MLRCWILLAAIFQDADSLQLRPIRFISRRAILPAIAVGVGARAQAGERTTAQSLGIDQDSVLFDPRDIGAEKGLVWGGRDRCDPTDAGCNRGVTIQSDVQPLPPAPADQRVTNRIRIEFSIDRKRVGDVELALYGESAPRAVDTFVRLATGVMANTAEEEPASLKRSQIRQVLKNKAIIFGELRQQGGVTVLVRGQTRPQRIPVEPPAWSDVTSLSHDAAGLLSMRRGGKSFEAAITPRPNPALDKEWLVIGRIEKGMEVIERINTLATNNYDQRPLAPVSLDRVVALET